ncbi:L-aspartate oxidase [Shewanella sp. OPT22]|nr:L-aspartate oxidase [Shewanella sp. OPT22]
MTQLNEHQSDVLVIGSGAAGLTIALNLAKQCKVILVSKSKLSEGSTYYAQGGIAAVFDDNDTVEAHIRDTKIAGGGLCEDKGVRHTIENSKEAILWLIKNGVSFDRDLDRDDEGTEYHLTREGGHSHRRILHTADATGKEIQLTLQQQALTHPNITVLERYNAVDLLTTQKFGEGSNRVLGAYVWNRDIEHVETIKAKSVVLATGGCSKVYQYTSNPDVSSGDGIAMAWRAGCRVANMEFNQFHPTCLYHPDARNFLLTEALRGEGAVLRRPDGSRFMPDFDERAELAPRDIVAQAIDFEIKRLGVDCMYLDITHKPTEFVIKHFPTIYHRCLELGIDITEQPIPVVPAAHYTCGGVMIDLDGKTDVDGLYAVGEVSYTGLHGANRLASNSLLECIVYARSASEHIIANIESISLPETLPAWDESQVSNSDEEVVIAHNWHELRLFMWDYVGIVRTNKRLERALRRCQMLQQEIQEYYSNFRVSNNLLELRNLVQVAELIIRSAMDRKESRGLHFNTDYPTKEDNPKPTILTPDSF